MNTRELSENKIKQFRFKLMEEEKSKNTIEKYMRDARAFMSFTDGKPVTKEMVVAYKSHLIVAGYAIRSVNSMLAAINSLFSFLEWQECRVKAIRVQRPAYCSEESELTRADYVRLVGEARRVGNERLELLIQTICCTGIRVSELPFITVEGIACGEAVVSLKGKTRKVFIVRELQLRLLCYAEKQGILSGPVFVTRNGTPMDRTNIWKQMKRLCQRAEVSPQKIFPHNFRHLFARAYYEAEKDIAKLADVLGHSNINTTRLYIISTGREHRQQLERLHLTV